jgi:hypothetical protein
VAPVPPPIPQPPQPPLRQPQIPTLSAAPPPDDTDSTEMPFVIHQHRGFYLRLGFGLGFALPSTDVTGHTTGTKYALSGLTEHLELAIGGTPISGLVLGGGIFPTILGSPKAKADVAPTSVSAGLVGLAVVGPFIDIYPNPRGGLHIQAAVGPAMETFSAGTAQTSCTGACREVTVPASSSSGTGWGTLLGLGLEGWIGRHCSMGGLIRFQYTSVLLEPENTTFERIDSKVLVIGTLLTFTYQ